MMRDPICVLFCVDNNYLPQAGVAVASLLDANPGLRLDVHVASFGRDTVLSTRVFDRALGRHPACKMIYIDLDDDLFVDLPIGKNFSKSMYTRLIVGRIIDQRYARVLYMDADILVVGGVRELWEVSLDGAVLAAVQDPFNISYDAIGFSANDPYFNSGILLLDMVRWREEHCEVDILSYVATHMASPWMDQDALNVVLRGRVKLVGLEWNYQPRCADVPASFLGLDKRRHARLRDAPRIIHFTTAIKPWKAAHRVHYSDRYFRVVRQAGLGGLLKRPRAMRPVDLVAALKTRLRWHFPRVFYQARARFKPVAAAAMYRAGPET